MRIRLLAVGQKMPAWVDTGYNEYAKRISGDCQLSLQELVMARRSKNSNIEQLKNKEADTLLANLKADETLVALDVFGKAVTTEQLAQKMRGWQMSGSNIALAIGGPDGLADKVLAKASLRLSLSNLTLPHPLVRVLVAEQLYRAWTINHGHPYHK